MSVFIKRHVDWNILQNKNKFTFIACSLSCSLLAALSCGTSSTGVMIHDSFDKNADAVALESSFDGSTMRQAQWNYFQHLDETGLYADYSTRTVSSDVLSYTVQYELWSDGAEKKRYLYIPSGQKINTNDMNNWTFPVGTKVWKEFYQSGLLIETRFLQKMRDGTGHESWLMIAYAWNRAQTQAKAVPWGIENALGTDHHVPSQETCAQCHKGSFDTLIGVSAIQLSRANGKSPMATLISKGLLTSTPDHEFQIPGDDAVKNALGYLHANCGHCHNDTSFLASRRSLRLYLRVEEQTPEQTLIYKTTLNAEMNHKLENGANWAVVPGAPEKSQLYYRMQQRDLYAMPPVGTQKVDDQGTELIRNWILSLH